MTALSQNFARACNIFVWVLQILFVIAANMFLYVLQIPFCVCCKYFFVCAVNTFCMWGKYFFVSAANTLLWVLQILFCMCSEYFCVCAAKKICECRPDICHFSPQMCFWAQFFSRISDFSTSVTWRHLKFLHMWRNFNFPTIVIHGILKFLDITIFLYE